jgi:hypothetical protein
LRCTRIAGAIAALRSNYSETTTAEWLVLSGFPDDRVSSLGWK